MKSTRSRAALVTAAAFTGLVAMPATAHAGKPFDRERYEFADVFDADICGIPAELSVVGSGVFITHPVKGSGGTAFFGHDNFEVTETWTTYDDDGDVVGSVSIERNANLLEQRATKVPGVVEYEADIDDDGDLETVRSSDVWTFQFMDAGTFQVYGADGRLLLKATGVFKGQEDFDTFGDSVPGGRPVPGTFEVLRDQTGRSFTEEQFCDAVLPELT